MSGVVVIAAALATAVAAVPVPQTPERRYALVVGENEGDAGDARLRFAGADAERMMALLRELGGVRETDAVLLTHVTAAHLRHALAHLGARLAAEATAADQLFVYVSAHADEQALHLRRTRFALRELNDFIRHAPVGVTVLVIDSCRSGAITRFKGLKPLSGPVIIPTVSELSGRVIITSSGADEFAQESDLLGGSYFTSYLAAGLRGAADTNGDGNVTLEEAYRYAYHRTVDATVTSWAGVQRPEYRLDLKGRGDLVLSRPGGAGGLLSIHSAGLEGWMVLDADGSSVVADFSRPDGQVTVALTPGRYRVRARVADGVLEKTVSVSEDKVVSLRSQDFVHGDFVSGTVKGSQRPAYSVDAGAAVATALISDLHVIPAVEARLTFAGAGLPWPGDYVVARLAVGSARATFAPRVRSTDLDGALGVGRALYWRGAQLRGALSAGAKVVLQDHVPVGHRRRTSMVGTVWSEAEMRFALMGPTSLYATARAGLAWLRTGGGRTWRPWLGAGGGLAVSL